MFVKSFWIISSISFTVSLFSFCFHDLSISKSGVLKSTTIIVWYSMCVLSLSKVSFINLGSFPFGHICSELRLPLSGFFSLMNVKCPSPSRLITFS
jgi:hypothetical protein